MSYGNMHEHYKEQAVNTMTSGELLVLLYDEVIKRLGRARLFLENNDTDGFETDVNRARDIIQYFQQSLDYNFDISINLRKLYDFMLYELSRAQASRSVQPLDDIIPLLNELRDTWKEADRLSRTK